MKIRIKTKITWVVGFFFALLVVITALSIWSLYRLRHDAGEILKDNHLTLTHVETMRQLLDALVTDQLTRPAVMPVVPQARPAVPGSRDRLLAQFETVLHDQEQNVTEAGEGEATGQLRLLFDQFRQAPAAELAEGIRRTLVQINALNLQAITRKNTVAAQTADETIAWLSIIGTILLLLSFSLIVNFPGYIANPIIQLTAGIRQIANKNYQERLHFESGDEFEEVAHAFNEMATRLDAYEHSNLAQILFEKRRIEALIANLSDAVIGLDENDRILFINPVAFGLLGLQDQSILDQYAPDVAIYNDLLRNVLQENTGQPLKIFSDGKESYFMLENVPVTVLHNQQSRPAGRVVLLKNVTPFRELDLAKTNFIATISHELKTPLAAIKMSLQLLNDNRVGQLNPEQQKLVGQVRHDTDRLLRLTGELLDLAQVETGNLRLTRIPTSLADLVTYATEATQAALADKQLRLDVQLAADLPMLLVDPEKTAWVLVNLLSNAAKHSPEGATIALRGFVQADQVVLTVRDFGKGIEEKYQQRLFEKYFQAPTNGGPTKSGTGLGLAISRNFMDAQGGRIWVESRMGDGALFGVALPIGN